MQAVAVNPRAREVGVLAHSEPNLGSPSDVKVRILEVGVCGTDREICSFEYGTPPAGSEHLVLGHESLGEVVEVGAAVQGLSPGDLVVPMVRRPCGVATCTACRAGRQDYCYTGQFVERGIKQAHGFMTELIVDDARYMNVVPRALREVAVLVEPLTIAEKAMAQLWNIQARLPWACTDEDHDHGADEGHAHADSGRGAGEARRVRGACHKALVLGAGPVGLLGAMTLAASGFETFVYARGSGSGSRQGLLAQIGATYFSAENTSLDEVARRIGNIDMVFEATGASRLAFEVLPFLGTNGVFVLTGVPGLRGPVSIDTDLLMRNLVLKNQALCGTVNAGKQDFEAAIADLAEFVRRWPEAVRGLITGHHPIDRARDLLLSPPSGIKEVIAFAA